MNQNDKVHVSMLITALKDTERANKLFRVFFEKHNFNIPFQEFLKMDFRIQIGAFLQFALTNNLKITVYQDIYYITVLSKSKIPEEDEKAMRALYNQTEHGDILLCVKKIDKPDYVKTVIGVELEVWRQAIIQCMEIINSENLFNKL